MENNSIIYWDKGQRGKITINKVKLISFFESKGFMKFKKDKLSYQLVQCIDNVIQPVHSHILTETVRDDLKSRKVYEVYKAYLDSNHNMKILIDSLMSFDGCFHKDNSEESFFYFKNGAIQVSKDDIKLIPFSDLDCSIWYKSIIQKNFYPKIKPEKSDFETFIFNVCGGDKKRKDSLESIIGYLLSDYKDSANAKAIIFLDAKIDINGEANGGSGKSLVGKAISKLRNFTQIPGKNLDTKSKFLFQQVEETTSVLFYDDVRTDFNFEDLYSVITGDMTVEQKNKQAFNIPFEKSPKILVSSNFVVKGTSGDSDERRLVEFEFSGYYNLNRTPLSEFKKRFFDDWNTEEEWNSFYFYMLQCAKVYLNFNLIFPESINLKNNKLACYTSNEFLEFSEGFKTNYKYDKSTLFMDFHSKFSPNRDIVKKHTFKKWLDYYARNKGLDVVHDQSNSKYYVTFFAKT